MQITIKTTVMLIQKNNEYSYLQ